MLPSMLNPLVSNIVFSFALPCFHILKAFVLNESITMKQKRTGGLLECTNSPHMQKVRIHQWVGHFLLPLKVSARQKAAATQNVRYIPHNLNVFISFRCIYYNFSMDDSYSKKIL